MNLLFFHGTEILATFGGGLIGLVIFVGMLAWALRGPSRPWSVPLVYILLGLSISIPAILSDIFFGLSVIVAFPWSVLLIFVSTAIEHNIGLIWFIPSIIINGAIIYLVAGYQSR